MHEYEFDEIEDNENLRGNKQQIKTNDESTKLPATVKNSSQRVRLNPKVEVIWNTSEKQKEMKLRNGN